MAMAMAAMAMHRVVAPPSSSRSQPPVLTVSLPRLPAIVCGRGDKRTAKGKRFRHSFGNSRPKKPNKGRGLPPTPLPAKAPEEPPAEAQAAQ